LSEEIGWIKLHRKIRENPFWGEKPFDKARAWIDIILSANHEPNTFLLGNEMVSVGRGEFVTSEKKLMAKWGWSKTKVRSFLNLLDKQSMIVKKTDSKKTTLEVLNYCIYQDKETTEKPQKNQEKTPKEPKKDTNKNEEELQEGKEDIYTIFEFWNSTKVTVHRTMSNELRGHINARLVKFSVEEVCNAITNYSTVLTEKRYYWTHKWTLGEFLVRGLDKFLDENKPLENFLNKTSINEGSDKSTVQGESAREMLRKQREQYKKKDDTQ